MTSLNLPSLALVDVLFGKDFDGHIVIWESTTKKSQFYSPLALPQLAGEIERLKPTNDLYIGVATQEQELDPKQRGGSGSTATVGGFFADIDFASSKKSHKAYPAAGSRQNRSRFFSSSHPGARALFDETVRESTVQPVVRAAIVTRGAG